MRRSTAVGLVSAALLAACGGGGSPASTPPAVTATTAAAATAGPPGLGQLEGTWHLSIRDVRLNYKVGLHVNATAVMSGDRVVVEARNELDSSRDEFTPGSLGGYKPGALEIACNADGTDCGAGLMGFARAGSQIQIVHRATGQPLTYGTGGCASATLAPPPAVPDLRILKELTATSFTFVDGQVGGGSSGRSPGCYQVLWTVVATKGP